MGDFNSQVPCGDDLDKNFGNPGGGTYAPFGGFYIIMITGSLSNLKALEEGSCVPFKRFNA